MLMMNATEKMNRSKSAFILIALFTRIANSSREFDAEDCQKFKEFINLMEKLDEKLDAKEDEKDSRE